MLLAEKHGVFGKSNVVTNTNTNRTPGTSKVCRLLTSSKRIGFLEGNTAWYVNIKEMDLAMFSDEFPGSTYLVGVP